MTRETLDKALDLARTIEGWNRDSGYYRKLAKSFSDIHDDKSKRARYEFAQLISQWEIIPQDEFNEVKDAMCSAAIQQLTLLAAKCDAEVIRWKKEFDAL